LKQSKIQRSDLHYGLLLHIRAKTSGSILLHKRAVWVLPLSPVPKGIGVNHGIGNICRSHLEVMLEKK
jgi:hypothetical protein